MKDPRWELFCKTGLVQAYNYYKAETQDASSGKRARHQERGL